MTKLSEPIIVDSRLKFTHAKGFALFFNNDTAINHALNAMMDEGATQWIAGDYEVFVPNHYYRRFSNIFMRMEQMGWIDKDKTTKFLITSDIRAFTAYLLGRSITDLEVIELTQVFEKLKASDGYTQKAQDDAVITIEKMRKK